MPSLICQYVFLIAQYSWSMSRSWMFRDLPPQTLSCNLLSPPSLENNCTIRSAKWLLLTSGCKAKCKLRWAFRFYNFFVLSKSIFPVFPIDLFFSGCLFLILRFGCLPGGGALRCLMFISAFCFGWYSVSEGCGLKGSAAFNTSPFSFSVFSSLFFGFLVLETLG